MRPRPPLPGGPYLVVGLARSGLAAARLLAARGETVIATDAGTPQTSDLPGVEVRVDIGRHLRAPAVHGQHLAVGRQHARGGDSGAGEPDDQVGPVRKLGPPPGAPPHAQGPIDCW